MSKVLYARSMVLLCIAAAVVLSPAALYANPATTPGEWREWTQDTVTRTGTRIAREPGSAEQQELFDHLTEIAALLRATPTLASPVGFDAKGSRKIDLRAPGWAAGREAPARALLSLYLYPYTAQRGGTVRASNVEWTGFIGVYVNDPIPFDLMGGGMRTLDGENWYLEPKPLRSVGPFTLYEQVADDRVARRGPQRFVVVAPADLPPLWLPVTTQEYATEIIQRWEGQLAQMRERLAQVRLPAPSEQLRRARESIERSTAQLIELNPQMAEQLRAQRDEALRQLDEAAQDLPDADREHAEFLRGMREAAEAQQAELEAGINAMNSELAALSVAERRAQAVGKLHLHRPGAQEEGEIVPVLVPGGSEPRGLVRVNRDLFDHRLPSSAPQLFLVNFHTNREFMAERFTEIERQLDWNALARMIR